MKTILVILFLFSSVKIFSQSIEKYQAVATSQTGGRYEILQSQIKRSNTFKLDKFTGQIFVFVSTKNDKVAWQEVPKNSGILDTTVSDRINYQLFMGGTMARDCFLLNINTGVTWVLVEDRKGNYAFEVFE